MLVASLLHSSPNPSYLGKGAYLLTLALPHQESENHSDLGSYEQLYILISIMGIASFGGKVSADIILMG